uniref:Bacteriorhodopsin-like protein n=1 Tax=viral metagenome TaxID=1070528 RepID=A0A6C0AUP3_9ZZZZ|tara:strand:+ start:2672 stop:3394 length:723 start_codon:yes stop_codon:yes gene_type:complete
MEEQPYNHPVLEYEKPSFEQQEDVLEENYFVKLTFYITYVFLMTTATITFIESITTDDVRARHILNLETCISVVATFFYSKFVEQIEEGVDYKQINIDRYTDWMITTPLMLLVLCLVFVYNTKTTLKLWSFFVVLVLNLGMILTGYLGEVDYMNRTNANIIGFGFFAVLFGYLYKTFLHKKYNFDNMLIFSSFFILWALYGVFYEYDEQFKNVAFNILDLFAKCFVGIFFWAYFTKTFTL